MKQLDKLLLQSFATLFFLVLLVVVFILFNRQMLFYYDDLIGKGLPWEVIFQFMFYFAVFVLPHALPLAVLLSTLICFGNLAEHEELLAMKAAGISPLRVILPIFLFTLGLSAGALYVNNRVVPRIALQAYTLLYDIKQKKPSMELREGAFYNGMPDVTIKVNQKFANDDAALKEVMLYDHRNNAGEEIWLADSGRMYTVLSDRFIKFELFNGVRYSENAPDSSAFIRPRMTRAKFSKTELIFDLASFELGKTNPSSFANHRNTKSRQQLKSVIDEMQLAIDRRREGVSNLLSAYTPATLGASSSLDRAREVRKILSETNETVRVMEVEKVSYEIQRTRILTNAFACVAMLLVGAPLGIIIRKGGLGKPVLFGIAFFVIFFVADMQAEKLANTLLVPPWVMWSGDVLLSVFGICLLARVVNTDKPFAARWISG